MPKRKATPAPPQAPLPPMCVLCQSVKKAEPINHESPEQNTCFEARKYPENYAPFHKDRRTLGLTCDGFSHLKTAVLGLRGGGRVTIRATPDRPKVELSSLGPLFNKE